MYLRLLTMKQLLAYIDEQYENKNNVSIVIQLPDCKFPEVITNPWQNIPNKRKYYESNYKYNLELKHNRKIKILGVIPHKTA